MKCIYFQRRLTYSVTHGPSRNQRGVLQETNYPSQDQVVKRKKWTDQPMKPGGDYKALKEENQSENRLQGSPYLERTLSRDQNDSTTECLKSEREMAVCDFPVEVVNVSKRPVVARSVPAKKPKDIRQSCKIFGELIWIRVLIVVVFFRQSVC